MALINVFDEGMRKVLVVSVAIIAVTVLAFAKIDAAVFQKILDVILYCVGIFVGGNALEHLKGLFTELKKAKTNGTVVESPAP